MNERIVTTKSELKEAVKEGVEVIVVQGELVKKLEVINKIQNLTEKKRNKLLVFATGAGAAIIAGIAAAPATGGMSMALSAAGTGTFALSSGIGIALVAGFLTVCAFIGVETIISLTKGYDAEFEIDFYGIGKTKAKFTKRS